MQNIDTEKRLMSLFDQVLMTLEDELRSDNPSPKTIELAMKFLRDNHISVDLSKDKKVAPITRAIPRLSDESLRLA